MESKTTHLNSNYYYCTISCGCKLAEISEKGMKVSCQDALEKKVYVQHAYGPNWIACDCGEDKKNNHTVRMTEDSVKSRRILNRKQIYSYVHTAAAFEIFLSIDKMLLVLSPSGRAIQYNCRYLQAI